MVNMFQFHLTRRTKECLSYMYFTIFSMIMSTRYTDDISIANRDHIARRSPIRKTPASRPSQRDRAIRDVYFEKRGALNLDDHN